jgi:hypothetical protein
MRMLSDKANRTVANLSAVLAAAQRHKGIEIKLMASVGLVALQPCATRCPPSRRQVLLHLKFGSSDDVDFAADHPLPTSCGKRRSLFCEFQEPEWIVISRQGASTWTSGSSSSERKLILVKAPLQGVRMVIATFTGRSGFDISRSDSDQPDPLRLLVCARRSGHRMSCPAAADAKRCAMVGGMPELYCRSLWRCSMK